MELSMMSVVTVLVLAFVAGIGWTAGSWLVNKVVSK